MSQFITARVKLTAWYTVIIMLISGLLSGLYYIRTINVIDLQYHRIGMHLQRQGEDNPGRFIVRSVPTELLQENFIEARTQILNQIFFINGAIIILGAAASYFLSGKTLHPIRRSLDEQQRFVADAAHELKTPVTALKTSLEVNLMDKKLPAKAKVVLTENLEDIRSLELLTEHLLTLARVDNNHQLVMEPVSVSNIINRAVKHLKPLAAKHQIKLDLDSLNKELVVEGDEDSLVEVLIILIDNAIKYSPANSTLTIATNRVGKNIELKIQDEGVGISKQDIPHIFDRFYRVEQSRTKQGVGGYGLGLSVAKKIITQHQGTISVSSAVAKGTTFFIRLRAT